MFNVAPIARETVFESMSEGVLVLNQNDVIIDYNNAAKRIFPELNGFVIGKKIDHVLHETPHLIQVIKSNNEADFKTTINGEIFYYHVRFSPVLKNKGYEVGRIINFVDATERVNLHKSLQKLATIDGLTQVYNRMRLMEKGNEILEEIKLNGGTLSLIMFDIDYFKRVNDTFGHKAGDVVIKHIVHVASKSLNEGSIIGRYGGEEFIICLKNTTLTEAYEIAEAIRKAIEENVIMIDKEEIRITSSFGISKTHGKLELDILINEADHALYSAKRMGRNCVQIFEPFVMESK